MGTLLFRKIESVVDIGFYIAMSISFWCVVFFSWICVKCQADIVTLPVYAIAVLALGFLVVDHAVDLPLICLGTDM